MEYCNKSFEDIVRIKFYGFVEVVLFINLKSVFCVFIIVRGKCGVYVDEVDLGFVLWEFIIWLRCRGSFRLLVYLGNIFL